MSDVAKKIDSLIKEIDDDEAFRVQRTFLKSIKYKGDIKKALKEEGYSDLTSPSTIKKSKTWQDLVKTYFPLDELMETERGLLSHKEWKARANSLDRIHKLLGSFNKQSKTVKHVHEYRNMSDSDLNEIIEGEFEEVNNDKNNANPKKQTGSGRSTLPTPETKGSKEGTSD